MIEQQTVSLTDVFDALDSGTTVITGNKRLAVVIRQSFEQVMIGKGLEVWPTPDILSWHTWLQRIWEEAVIAGTLSASGTLLTPNQEQRIWHDIITESTAHEPLLQITGAVRWAQEAWLLMQSWQLSLDEAIFGYNHDSAAFWRWARQFETKCVEQGWIPNAQLADALQYSIEAKELAIPVNLMLIGFDELTPQQQTLLLTAAEMDCHIRWVQLADVRNQTARIECIDAQQEANVMARWMRQRLEDNPAATIGVVVPELASRRDSIIHALDEIMVPHAIHPAHHATVRPYNISLGLPLNSFPIISTAIKLLSLLQPCIGLEDASKLLRSPFISGWEQEFSARALLDGRLREIGELWISLKTLLYHAAQTNQHYACPVLVEKLNAWIKAAQECPHTDTPGQWSERLARLLKTIGWTEGRPLSSEEFQAVSAWQELLGTFAALEPVTKPLTVSAAISQLQRMAEERTFQPQTGAASAQVLGMLEASGLQFDHLWIMGLHDDAWPASPQPNPFIPLPVQRAANLPHSSEQRELHVSRTITKRLLTSAAEVIVSYPQRNGDETLRPSPLIADLPIVKTNALHVWPASTWQENIHNSAKLVTLTEDPAPYLEHEAVSGGSAVFKLQAACPFRAFAELRLGARALGQADIGLNTMARGALVHRILEKVWGKITSQAQLIALAPSQLKDLVSNMINEAIAEIANKYPQTFTDRFRKIETERLYRQVLEWLELEKKREPFQVIEREKKYQTVAGGIHVQLKIDRIDELADGSQLVIDYKTGAVKPAQWFGERPDEPQLPLYSMAVGGDIAGVVFAQIKIKSMAFNGVTKDEELIPGVKSYQQLQQTGEQNSWSAVLNVWRETMTRLGQAFRNGEAMVDPKQYPTTCTYCQLRPLCRINELIMLVGDATDTTEQA